MEHSPIHGQWSQKQKSDKNRFQVLSQLSMEQQPRTVEGQRPAQGELQHILPAPPILKITDNPIHISDIDLDIEINDAVLEEQ